MTADTRGRMGLLKTQLRTVAGVALLGAIIAGAVTLDVPALAQAPALNSDERAAPHTAPQAAPQPTAIPNAADATPNPPAATPDSPRGKVLFSTDAPPPPGGSALFSSSTSDEPAESGPPDQRPPRRVTDAERLAVHITDYQLEVHLLPAASREEVHAGLVVRNVSAAPLARIPLQLSSTLRWQSVSALGAGGPVALPFTQAPIASDTDHTGYTQEVVLTPGTPLLPGQALRLSVFFSGTIRQSAARLELIGAPAARANASDWDAIRPTSDAGSTALRGFGDVLWYPVAGPAAVFGDTDKLFDAIRRQRLRNASTSIALRLTVDYVGDPPNAAIFDGQLRPLVPQPDTTDQLVAVTHGVAVAEFPSAPIGFRTPSLFLTAQHAIDTERERLSVLTPNPEALPPYAEAANALASQLTAWLGPGPQTPLLLLDQPGEPFEDETLLVGALSPRASAEAAAPELVRGLTHAWFNPQSPPQTWLNFGVAEMMALVSTENLRGRDVAVGELAEAYNLLALGERAPDAPAAGAAHGAATEDAAQGNAFLPLTEAYSDVYLRYKSLAVLWQLREQLGESELEHALTAFLRSLTLNPALGTDPKAFEHSLEKTTGKDFAWFFDDWVYADRGLPDLTIGDVNARPLPAGGGKSSGYLVAVQVNNSGGAVADVPVRVSNDNLTATERLRIPAHSGASVRIVFEGTPASVQVNDGSMPENGVLSHRLQVRISVAP